MNHIARPRPRPRPRGSHIVRFLAHRPEFAGVGPATAQRLWDAWGEDLYRILGDGDLERLAEVLPKTQAEIVIDAWRNQQAIADTVVFFDELGLDDRVARKAAEFWGDEAVAKLRDNPYRLLTIFRWVDVDRCARLLGVAPDDERRLVGAVEATLHDRLDEKHTATPPGEVVRRVVHLLRAPREAAERALAAADEAGAAVASPAGYQPAGAAYAERYVEERLAAALENPERQRDLLAGSATPAGVEAFLRDYDEGAAHPLTEEQRAAVRMVMSGRLSILTGGAGVGKTTCLRAINAIARRFGYDVHQIALAGRAAQRMSDATGQGARTIASWLSEASRGRLATGAGSLVVVDEASMLDLPTMYRLLWHLHEDARLLLVGDVGQLPPIGYGLVLHRLVRSRAIPKVELTRVLRAVESTGIPMVSRAVRSGAVPPLLPYRAGQPGCSFVPCAPEEVVGVVERIRGDLEGDEVQVIAATYAGPAGIDALNTHFHRFNAHGRPRLGRFAEGDPVIWLKNDYERGLWNGSMGAVVGVGGDRLRVTLDGRSLDLAREDLGDLDLAYAISCHKAQGSQWGTVIVPIARSRLMDRALLYTALTRAQTRVVLVGDRALLEETIRRPPPSLSRDVALSV